MKKFSMTVGMVFCMIYLSTAQAKGNVVDTVSEFLIPEHLFLVNDGEYAPHTTEEGDTMVNYQLTECNGGDKDCNRLLMSYKPKSMEECLHPNMGYRFDELPVTLSGGRSGIYSVPTITDPSAVNSDYFIFSSGAMCYEIDWGYSGSHFDKVIQLANYIIESGR